MNNARLAYQEGAVRGASPVRLTILLYEQVIQYLTRAMEAIGATQDGELRARTESRHLGDRVLAWDAALECRSGGGPQPLHHDSRKTAGSPGALIARDSGRASHAYARHSGSVAEGGSRFEQVSGHAKSEYGKPR